MMLVKEKGDVIKRDVHSEDSINWTDEDIGDVIEFESDGALAFKEDDLAASKDDDDR